MTHRVRAIRWLTFSQNYNTGPEDQNLNAIHDEELIQLCLQWELNPTREVSCEIIRSKSRTSFCIGYGAIGLEVDLDATELTRVYADDGCTIPNELGELRSVEIDEDEPAVWGRDVATGWENARKMFDSFTDRTTWCEGIIRSPKYKAVIVMEDDDFLDEELVEQVIAAFQLPMKSVRRSSYFNLDD